MVTRKPEEELLLALLGIAAVGLAVRKAGGFWSETLGPWAVDHGVLIAHGDATSGYSLFVRNGRLVHDMNIGQ